MLNILEILAVFLRLGLTSFGGPVAHLGYFRQEFVTRRRWLDDAAYSDIVALCQFLPGPASSQVGMAIGLSRAGIAGAIAAWIGFTLPSALIMIVCAKLLTLMTFIPSGVLEGLKAVAVAVVAQAVWGMARSFCPDAKRLSLAVMSAVVVLVWANPLASIAVMTASGLIGWRMVGASTLVETNELPSAAPSSRKTGVFCLSLFVLLLFALPILSDIWPGQAATMVAAFYRVGALVFGGGHVVLPLLQTEVVPRGWISEDAFLAGYGLAQALPGPIFSFAAFLGATPDGANGLNGLLAIVAIFAPAFLLVAGIMPFWHSVRQYQPVRAALNGVNAGVVGLLLAALYHPIWTSTVHKPQDFALVLLAGLALVGWKLPPWLVVLVGGALGGLMALFS